MPRSVWSRGGIWCNCNWRRFPRTLMSTSRKAFLSCRHKTALATCFASALGIAATDATATCASLAVTSCADSGAGTLRSVVACADSGNTVDLGNLSCSTISLASHIDVLQASLYLQGPGADALSIDAGNNDRVFVHHLGPGAGTLSITGLTLAHGRYQSSEPQG